MSQVTKPILLDETGQAIVTELARLGGSDSVHYSADTGKSDAQKAQARTNIGAIDASVNNLANYYDKTYINNTLAGIEAEIPDVINNVTSTATDDALSANMGKELQAQITNLQNIGRFLAIWNCTTGKPLTDPTVLPYSYRTGDYYRVGIVGATNYKPNGATYDGTASTTVDTGNPTIGAVYYYDGSVWQMQASGGGGTVQDVQLNGTSVLTQGIANITDSDIEQVKYSAQELTTNQKIQARANIGAMTIQTYDSTVTPIDGVFYIVEES